MSIDPGHNPNPPRDIADAYRLVGLDPPTLRRADLATATQVPAERMLRWWRALGFPEEAEDEIAFRQDDIEIVSALGALVDAGELLDTDVLRLARIMGASFSRLVDAQLDVLEALAELADSEADVIEFMESTMTYVWRRHLLAGIGRRLSVDASETDQAVGFIDLSGFSRLSKRASAAELTEIIDTFEAAAFDVVSGHAGRVVKLIGDEAMFVTGDIDTAVAIGLELIERLAGVENMPPVHGGLAYGPTVTIGGDVFGPTVNLASRLTTVARPGCLALPRGIAPHLLERKDLDARRVRRSYDLKGIGRTSILTIRPQTAPTEQDA